jgi:hypothetical protein
MNWPQETAKIAKKKRHNLFSLSSLRSFAAKIFLEWRYFFLQVVRISCIERKTNDAQFPKRHSANI